MNDLPSHDADVPEELFLEARLSPHRSLSPRGFLILTGALAAISFPAGLAFVLIGAWPVVGFMGLCAVLFYMAFRMNYRHGLMYETVRLTRCDLRVESISHRGETRTWCFQPYWLQVLIDDPPRHDSDLTLRSHGRSLSIGRFLTPAERGDLAEALRAAIADTRRTRRPAPVS